MTKLRRRMAVVVLLLGAGLPIAAQTLPSTGSIYGTVVDAAGAPAAGVEATLNGGGERAPVRTDAGGKFRFLYISPGTYSVTFALTGFATVESGQVVVAVDRNTQLRITLKAVTTAETVTLTGALPSIDARKTVAGATFPLAELQEIPTARNVWAWLWAVPGVVSDQVSVAGSTTRQTIPVSKGTSGAAYNYDGADITYIGGGSPTYYNYDAFQEIQVVTGGSDASLQTGAATFNLVTKRGTNAVRGSARYFYAPNRWQADNTPAEVDVTQLQANRTNVLRDYGAEAGGAVVADRVWLWGGWGDNEVDLFKVGQVDPNGRPVSDNTTLVNFDARLDAQLAASNSLELFYHHGQRTEDGLGVGLLRAPESGLNLTQPTPMYKVSDTQVFSPSLTASMFFAYLGSVQTTVPVGGVDTPMYFDPDGVLRGSNMSREGSLIQRQVGLSASKFFTTGNLSHELKFGFGYRYSTQDSMSSNPANQVYGDESLGFAWITRSSITGAQTQQFSGFVSDTLTVDRLTVNAGLRYDYARARNTASSVPGNPTYPEILPAVQYAGDDGYPIAAGSWQPRVGATYALGEKGQTLLRASYARFADLALGAVFLNNALPGIQGIAYGWNDVNGNHVVDPGEVDFEDGVQNYYGVDPSNPSSLTSPNQISPDLKPTTIDEFVVGVDRELFAGLTGSIQYTHRSIHDIPFAPYIGVTGGGGGYEYSGNATGTATDPFGYQISFDVPFFGLTLDPPPSGIVLETRPGYGQTYQGVGLQLVKPLSERWMLRATAAWNSWKQSVTPESIFDPNDLAGDAQGQLGGPNRNGGVVTGTPDVASGWTFSLDGMYQLPYGFAVSGAFAGRQGFPLEYFARIRTNDTAGNVIGVLTSPVGAYRLPDVYELDLRLEKTFRIGPVSVIPSLDVFNVANANTVLSRRTRVGTYNASNGKFSQDQLFNLVRSFQSPRIFRAGVRAAF